MSVPELQIERMQNNVSVPEYVEKCVDIPKFLACCEQCKNYENRWSCPPFSFSVEDFWKKFNQLLLWGCKIHTPTEWLNKSYDKEELAECYRALLKPVKAGLLSDLLEMESHHPGSICLSAGSCETCDDVCAKILGQPCFHPEQMRYSIEALGGDVGKSIELYLGEKLVWAENGKLPPYFILLGGLLTKEEL